MTQKYYISVPSSGMYFENIPYSLEDTSKLLISKFKEDDKELQIDVNSELFNSSNLEEYIKCSAEYISDAKAAVFLAGYLKDRNCKIDMAIAKFLGVTIIII